MGAIFAESNFKGKTFVVEKRITKKEKYFGEYAEMRKKYLRESLYNKYVNMLLAGQLDEHLKQVEMLAECMHKELKKDIESRLHFKRKIGALSEQEWHKEMVIVNRQIEDIIVTQIIQM